jgi:hypothetical protein
LRKNRQLPASLAGDERACDHVKARAAWLSGQTPLKHSDTEQTISELRARIQKTIAFTEGCVLDSGAQRRSCR